MQVILIKRKLVKQLAMFSVAVILLNFLTLRYLVTNDIEHVDMTVLAGKTVALDPGHGGIDDGASGNSVVEKEVTLAIATKLSEVLKANGAQIVMTRENDTDYYTRGKGGKRNDLMKRVEIINNSGAQAFVSIHVNSIKGGEWSGAQVFYNPKLVNSKTIAEAAQQALRNFPPGNKRQAKQDSTILVLNSTNIPGILVETGFLSNKDEAALLADRTYQQKMADQIAKALAYYFSQDVAR